MKVAGLEPATAPDLGSVAIHPSLSAGEVGRANLRRHLAAWLAHEPAARLGEEPEKLHELRVAGRRIETTLRVFEPYLPKTIVRQRPAWKSLVRALGSVRDLDVQLGGLTAFVSELHDGDAAQLSPLRERLEAERRIARSRMIRHARPAVDAAPGSSSACRAGQAIPGAGPVGQSGGRAGRAEADSPEFQEGQPRCAGGACGRQRIRAPRLRRRTKRLRYTIESFDGFYDDEARKLLKAISAPAEEPGLEPGCARRRGPVPCDGQLSRQALAARDVVLDRRSRRAASQRRRRCPSWRAEALRKAPRPSMEGLAARNERAIRRARHAPRQGSPPDRQPGGGVTRRLGRNRDADDD